MMNTTRGWLCCLLTAGAALLPARAAEVWRGADGIEVTFPNGTTRTFALQGDLLLGLKSASVAGVELTSPRTVQFPLLAQEWANDRTIWPLLRLKEAKPVGEAVELRCELLGTTDERAYRAMFVYAGDREKALGEAITPRLTQLKAKRDAAAAVFEETLAREGEIRKIREEIAEAEKQLAKAAGREKQTLAKKLKLLQKEQVNIRNLLRPSMLFRMPGLQKHQDAIDAFDAAVAERALEVGTIHRDYYRFAHLRQPEAACDAAAVGRLAGELGEALKPAGTLTWTVAPERRNIAGWNWVGWRQHYRFQTAGGRKVNVLRQLGTWELDGKAPGTTVVNLRYRGLGRIEQALTAGDEGGVREAWTTTEIVPGAVKAAPLVSPIIPASIQINDRGFALAHRAGAWIAHMARGAGHGFVDFQFRPPAAFCSFFLRQGSLRAMSEVFPGDACISQTDEEWFADTDAHATSPQVYLALVTKDAPLKCHESRTRWQEVDQYVRDLVSAELGFVPREPLPGVGILSDAGWAGYYTALAKTGLDGWADAGVRLVAYHNPGWVNGRYQGPKGDPKTPKPTGGGVCNVYDWWPTWDVVEPWQTFQKACARRGVAFYPWLGQTIWRDGAFARRVGLDVKLWALNAPGDTHGAGYGPQSMKGNILHDRFRQVFSAQIEKVRTELGCQGFWADSFQNLFMSQLDWANTGDSQQRRWWEQIAAWSRQGLGWMAESHSFPGLSCSIEVPGWEEDYSYFQHVWKWHRGDAQGNYAPAELDRIAFRVMANKGWTAPDHSYKTHPNFAIPSFKRFAHEYLAALPKMRRSYVLPGEAGVLWLTFADDAHGVWFAFGEQDVPKGVQAAYLLDADAKPITQTQLHHTYAVHADDLLRAFGLRRGPEKDPRLGRKYTPPTYTWPQWATK